MAIGTAAVAIKSGEQKKHESRMHADSLCTGAPNHMVGRKRDLDRRGGDRTAAVAIGIAKVRNRRGGV